MFDAECSFTKAAMFGYFRKYRFLQSRSQPRQNCAVEELVSDPSRDVPPERVMKCLMELLGLKSQA